MKNIKLVIAYDGTEFCGSQRQPDKRTVQGEIEKALKKITKEDITMAFAGRTDSGVHATMQVANFWTESSLPAIAFKHKLTKYLPKDILILSSEEESEDFHSRFSAKSKRYRYIINNSKTFFPHLRNYQLHIKHALDIEKMREASKKLLGVHDYRAFMKFDEDKNSLRSIDEISIVKNGDEIILEFQAESFLYNQIRITVGLLIDIGRGFRDLNFIDDIFSGKVERAAKTYTASGLYLIGVFY